MEKLEEKQLRKSLLRERQIKFTFSLAKSIQEKLAKKLEIKTPIGREGDYLIVAPKVFCGNFFIEEMYIDRSQLSIMSTGFCLVEYTEDDILPFETMSSIMVRCLQKEKPDIFFIDTKAPSKTFKIRYYWIDSIEPG